ncbi:hypothetical protein [Phosphitispora fastidiosa]|uniref:hypothetical protein n=1 Tax=Phosphitispora fastidiosa TaxID=2837202 RepID=UPI001E622AA3|nr:hypothetical protein [Phosphitispora fastidiosa]MBU7008624.1 hypothetical protein [Phosphitispora fastidiosa]
MIIIIRKIRLLILAAALILTAAGFAVLQSHDIGTGAEEMDYRVFVAGMGTVAGKWCGQAGIAVIGVETRPAAEEDMELKFIDLLVANSGKTQLDFAPDIGIAVKDGRKYELHGPSQPQVVIKPGALSQGTVVISIPEGIPETDCSLEIRGGNLKSEKIMLPLRVITVEYKTPNTGKN